MKCTLFSLLLTVGPLCVSAGLRGVSVSYRKNEFPATTPNATLPEKVASEGAGEPEASNADDIVIGWCRYEGCGQAFSGPSCYWARQFCSSQCQDGCALLEN